MENWGLAPSGGWASSSQEDTRVSPPAPFQGRATRQTLVSLQKLPLKLPLLRRWEEMEGNIHSHFAAAFCPTAWTCPSRRIPARRCSETETPAAVVSKGSLIVISQEKRWHRLKHRLHLGGWRSRAGASGGDTAAGGSLSECEDMALATVQLGAIPQRGLARQQQPLSHASQGSTTAPCALSPALSWGGAEREPLPARTFVGADPPPAPARPWQLRAPPDPVPVPSSVTQGPACTTVARQGWGISIPAHFKLLLFHSPSFTLGCVLQDGSVSSQAAPCRRKRLSLRFAVQLEACSSFTPETTLWGASEAGSEALPHTPCAPHFGNSLWPPLFPRGSLRTQTWWAGPVSRLCSLCLPAAARSGDRSRILPHVTYSKYIYIFYIRMWHWWERLLPGAGICTGCGVWSLPAWGAVRNQERGGRRLVPAF